jgi:hypothetical protein
MTFPAGKKCATQFIKCGVLWAFSALGNKTKVVDNFFLFTWPLESTQSEFICSRYSQNTKHVSGDLELELISSF